MYYLQGTILGNPLSKTLGTALTIELGSLLRSKLEKILGNTIRNTLRKALTIERG